MSNPAGSINRITKEITSLQKADDLSLAVAFKDSDVRHVRALIVGPSETPYEFGFFEFDIKFPKSYPIQPPSVKCTTTNGGRCRFNPNVYSNGKVCLSILGTWRGEPGEQWSSAQGLESLLLSIQSLLSPNPYENEPGFEGTKLSEKEALHYARKVRHESLRISVVQRLEQILNMDATDGSDSDATAAASVSGSSDGADPDSETPATEPSVYEYDADASTFDFLNPTIWDPFTDLIKRRFLWYYDSYARAIDIASKEQKDGHAFPTTPFEGGGNEMTGSYQYLNLRARLDRIRTALAKECGTWRAEGAEQVKTSTQLAVQLAFQFEQLKFRWNESSYAGTRMEVSLPNKSNPFAWHLTLFGAPSTNLDGGVFNLSFTIPPEFPEAWPRVYVETPFFHHRISPSTGALCYFPQKVEDVGSHLEAIVRAVEDEKPAYDPRAVLNLEAAELLWGDESKKKIYFRKLRRSAQDSSEF